jgi:glycosyltransferase involved in cell wall biosynthesis
MSNKEIVIVANNAWNLIHFRSELIAAIIEAGFNVTTILSKDDDAAGLHALGVNITRTQFSFRSRNSFIHLLLFFHVVFLIFVRRPSAILTFTIVPNIYCSIAAGILNIPVINNVTGFGSAFYKSGLTGKIITKLIKFAFRKSKRVFVQNETDMEELISLNICTLDQIKLIPGSGININKVPSSGMPKSSNFIFLMASRIIRDKGVMEYLTASELVKKYCPETSFYLYGDLDLLNPSSISQLEFSKALSQSSVQYHPFSENILDKIRLCHCVVLPSYREGLSRFLLEGGASSKIIVASDVPGCRELVRSGYNGYLSHSKDPISLANSMIKVLSVAKDQRIVWGERSRRLIEEKYDVKIIVLGYLNELRFLCK